jgi:hypothetical protein
MLAALSREEYLRKWSEASRTIPDKKKATIVEAVKTGVLFFLFGFFIWNLDNIFCNPWTRIKQAVGWPIAFFMEGRFVKHGALPYLQQYVYRSRVVACIHCARISQPA